MNSKYTILHGRDNFGSTSRQRFHLGSYCWVSEDVVAAKLQVSSQYSLLESHQGAFSTRFSSPICNHHNDDLCHTWRAQIW